jgi:EpsI family protein
VTALRLTAAGVLMGAAALGCAWRVAGLTPAPNSTLAALPLEIDGWRGRSDPPLTAAVAAVLRADEYLLRTYIKEERVPVGMYVAFYRTQQSGATVHSPLNCLPGSGWDPVETGRVGFRLAAGSSAEVNRYIVQKGTNRQAVFYWFQSRARIVASEYTSKFLLARDAFMSGRSDGAIVRLSIPIGASSDAADRIALEFARLLYPLLVRHLPA